MIWRLLAVVIVMLTVVHIGAVWTRWSMDILPRWDQLIFPSFCVVYFCVDSVIGLWRQGEG